MPNVAFSAEVASDRGITVERAMYFNQDGHTTAAVTAPSRTWYLPEGFTSDQVDTWLLIYNPNPTPARVAVTFLRENGSGSTFTVTVTPRSRYNLRANGRVEGAFSTQVASDLPIVVERSTYFDRFGHGSMGSMVLSSQWYFADVSATADTWLLVLNPQNEAVNAVLTFSDERGAEVRRSLSLRPRSRTTVHISDALPKGALFGLKLEAVAPVAAERAMYEAGGGGASSMGSPAPSLRWLLPEGSTAPPFRESVLLYNPGGAEANVDLILVPTTGSPTSLSAEATCRTKG
jgi:hypothetical protein